MYGPMMKEGWKGFRGFTAPASLKRLIRHRQSPFRCLGFPGLYRPGLIEARLA